MRKRKSRNTAKEVSSEWRDFLVGLILLIFFCVFYFIIPIEVEEGTEQLGLSPAFFPRVSVLLLIILCSFLVFKNVVAVQKLKRRKVQADRKRMEGKFRVIALTALCILYVYILSFLGYFISTSFFMISILWLFEVRKWRTVAMVAIVTPLVIYIIFGKIMMLPFPKGRLLP